MHRFLDDSTILRRRNGDSGGTMRIIMPFLVLLRFIVVFVAQIAAFFFFYKQPYGQYAVYDAWYAWLIDLLAILSGMFIMGATIYAYLNPWIFTFTVPPWIFWVTFIVGGWQAGIHIVKWVIRTLR